MLSTQGTVKELLTQSPLALLYREVERVKWSDESSFSTFLASRWVCVWRRPGERYGSDCSTPTARESGGSVVLWGAFYRHGVGPLSAFEGKVTAQPHKVVLSDQYFYPDGSGLSHDDDAPIQRVRGVTAWFDEYGNDENLQPLIKTSNEAIQYILEKCFFIPQ